MTFDRLLRPVIYQDLPGWTSETFQDAYKAWSFSCQYLLGLSSEMSLSFGGTSADWEEACQAALTTPFRTSQEFVAYLSHFFQPYQILDLSTKSSLFTSYYEPILKGSRQRSTLYCIPLYAKPPELFVIEDLGPFKKDLKGHRIGGSIQGKAFKPYFTRQEIYEGALEGRGLELVWVDSWIDAYFMAVQGSGLIQLDTGEALRLSYNGTNGYEYTSIGQVLIQRHLSPPAKTSMQFIRQWLKDNPQEMFPLFNQNRSYVFFKELSEAKAPFGALGKPLTPLRSLAVDPVYISLGLPLWIDTLEPPLQRFMVAQDVGGAIKGPLRGDIFWGTGIEAGEKAGTMKTSGNLYVFLPKHLKIEESLLEP